MGAGFFFFKQKTAYEILSGLVGSEMCIRDRLVAVAARGRPWPLVAAAARGRGRLWLPVAARGHGQIY